MKMSDIINLLFVLWGAARYKVAGTRVPLIVSLGLTDRCNLRCPFCYATNGQTATVDYTTTELKNYIDQFIRLGARVFLLQGGEPLLRNDLEEVIAYIKDQKRLCRISTNGVLVANRIESLRHVDQISFSLEGNEEVVDKIRGKGIYQKVVLGMEAAHKNKIPFEIHATLIRESALNRESVVHILELARRFGTYASFCIASVTGAEHTRKVGSGDLSRNEIKAFYEFLMTLKKQGYPVSNSYNSLKKSLLWPLEYSEIGFLHNLPPKSKFIRCRHGKLICWLDAEHKLWPCPITFYRKEFGVPIKEGNVKVAWEELGKKTACLACGGSDESTTFLALKGEDLAEGLLKLIRSKAKG